MKMKLASKFNTRFSKIYHRIPNSVRPNAEIALLYYFKSFDGSFGFFLGRRNPEI
jgi:hypothetical protein